MHFESPQQGLALANNLVAEGRLTFTFEEVEKRLGKSKTATANLLKRMQTAGLIDRVRRGHYAVRQLGVLGTPVAAEDVALSVGAALKGLPHRIAYRSALYEHDLVVHPARSIGWLGKLPIEAPFVFHNARKLFRAEPISRGLDVLKSVMASDEPSHRATIHGSLTWMSFGDGNWPILLSARERAILELVDELPDKETFHQADVLMEGLVNLSPRRMSRCLRQCRSVKVKRLFLWFAERHGQVWLDHLDRGGIDLGSGKRLLVRGGRLDRKNQITVPEDLDAGG